MKDTYMQIKAPQIVSFSHHEAHHFQYEKISAPWYGPIKRAKNALLSVTVKPLSPEQYLDYLKTEFPRIYKNLEWVQFYQFKPGQRYQKNLPSMFEFRLAVTYLRPEPDLRDESFRQREKITQSTGWYPLTMGSKAEVTIPSHHFPKVVNAMGNQENEILDIGVIQKIKDVASTVGGNSILLSGSQGSILFDTGFGVFTDEIEDLRGVCISHFHKDHSGGIWEIFESLYDHNFPVYLSEPTIRYLWQKKSKDPASRKRLLRASRIVERKVGIQGTNKGINYFPVFHAPGSYGFYYVDSVGKCFIYPGDLCLQNGFYNSSDTLLQTINSIPATEKWVMIDAALANQSDLIISEDDQPQVVINNIVEAVQKRNVSLISQSSETLIYSLILTYLDTQKNEKTQSIKLVVGSDLLEVCQSLLGPMLYHDYDNMDPFVFSVMKKDIKNFVESFRVYPISALSAIHPSENVVVFATPTEVASSSELRKRIYRGDVYLTGALAAKPEIPQEINSLLFRSIIRLASTDWSFHSSLEHLLAFLKRLTDRSVHCVLFHSDPTILQTLTNQNGLDQKYVHVHTAQGINL
jgi:glyoxylase-like metal-dependent hydrolase (beta-lactamase superfamily II)